MSKLLIVSLHPQGGCYQYSNEIIERIKCEKEVFLNGKTFEKHNIKEYKTLKLYGFGTVSRYMSLFFFLFRIFFGGITGKYNALLLMGFASWDPYIARVFKSTGKPVFYVIHDGKVHQGETLDYTQKRLLSAMKNATHHIYLSDYVRNLVKKNFNIDKKYHIAPHGLLDYGDVPQEPKKKRQKPVLLFMGRLSLYKGIEILLDAIDQLPDVYDKLVIAGKSMQGYSIEINNPKIELINKWLTEEEMVQLLNNSDILILPYLEATQSGIAMLSINYLVPSIVSNTGGFKEQYPKNGVLFIEPEVASLKKAIIELASDDILYNNISGNLEKFRHQYSWDEITSSLEDFIQKQV